MLRSSKLARGDCTARNPADKARIWSIVRSRVSPLSAGQSQGHARSCEGKLQAQAGLRPIKTGQIHERARANSVEACHDKN
jgi:hypothetical protein